MNKYILLFLLALVTLSCGTIRDNGVYQTTEKEGYYHYVRFYKDSVVLTVSSSGEPHHLKKWFNKEKEDISKGTFTIKNDSIFFKSTSENGIVVYKGRIKRNKMKLYSKSEINGHTSTREYHFERFK